MVTLYTINCPKCKVVEMKLDQKGIEYKKIENEDEVVKFGAEHNVRTAPILVVDDKVLDFSNAIKYINER